MTNVIHRQKPYAGNPHVRFDEGEVASAKPRRGSLLYKGSFSQILAVLVVQSACMAFADNDVFVVPVGTTYTVDASAEHGTNDILGTLVVPSGFTFKAYDNWLGRTGSATLSIQGGTYGTSVSSGSTPHRAVVGDEGGTAAIELTAKSSKFQSGDFIIRESAAAHGTGYVDVLTSSAGKGNSAEFSVHRRYNKSAHTARIRVLSGTLSDTTSGISYYDTRYQNGGAWLIEVSKDATHNFLRSSRSGALAAAGASVTVRGEGTVGIKSDGGDGAWNFVSGFVFGNADGIKFLSGSNKAVTFADGVIFEDTFGGMSLENAQTVYFGGNVNLGSLTATSTGRFMASSGKSPILTFGTANRDATLTGEVFGDNCGFSLVKTGAGTLTTSATTPYLPALAFNEGALVIQGAFSCPSLIAAAGTSITVDGGTWTIEGDQLMQADGSTIETVHGGSIIVKVVDGKVPTFAAGSKVKASQYWIDGEQQPNGTYQVGGATLEVYEFPNPDEIWTNAGKSGEAFDFAGFKEYKGLELVKTDAPLTFTGGPVALGSSGISVEDTPDAAMFDFDLPLFAPVDQTWAFGAASVVFRKPFTAIGAQRGKIAITSTADVTVAATNSTFEGAFAVSATNVAISGCHPFGAGTETATVKGGKNGKIVLRDVVFTQTVSFNNGGASRDLTEIYGTNSFQSIYYGDNFSGCTFQPNSETVFNGAVEHYDYNSFVMGSGARVVCTKPGKYHGYAGSSSLGVLPAYRALVKPVVRYEAPNTVLDKASGHYGPDYYLLNFYGKRFNSGIRVELAADHVFKHGWFGIEEGTVIDLCGYNQGMSFLVGAENQTTYGAGEVTSAEPAFLELDVPSGESNAVNARFTGKAGFRMIGAGTATLAEASATTGGIEVVNGAVTLATVWSNATSVAVSAGGRLTVTADKAVPKTAAMSLGGVGALSVLNASGRLRVDTLTLKNPTTGETVMYKSGVFNSANTWGLVSAGSVQAGNQGLVLIVR